MPIRPPALDDRRFDDLVAELVARIPAHTPEWTHPQIGDPGRTLIELFAWLGDALLYRANLSPERQRLAFLRLLGQPLRPARPARGLVTLALKENDTAALALKPELRFTGPMPFEARREITVLPLTLAAYYKRATDRSQLATGLDEALAELHGRGAGAKFYTATPLFGDGRPEPGGFDAFGTPSDRCVWLGLFSPKAELNDAVRESLKAAATNGRPLLNVGFVPALPQSEPLPIVQSAGRASVPHVWEITVKPPGTVVDEDHAWTPEYLALDQVADSTRGFTRAGVVRLSLPPVSVLHAPTSDVRADLNAGVGDRPPRLDDEKLAQRLIAWVRLRPKLPSPAAATETQFATGPNPSPAVSGTAREIEHLWLSWLGINAVEVEQLTTRTNLVIGESDGSADQEFQLPATSVEPETLQLSVEGDNGLAEWRRVEDLSALDRDTAASRDAQVFQLDAEAGVVRFGDGVRGYIPAPGRRIVVTQLRAGGGQAGNLPAGSLAKVAATTLANNAVNDLVVQQRLPFAGGENAEDLAEGERRIPALFRHRERAVTPDDYRTLARETPGVRVARAEVLPLFKPQQRLSGLPGVVTLLALPLAPLAPAPYPRADRPFLEAVHAWLDARRPVATEFYAIGCEYLPVAVSVAISLREHAEPNATEQAVKDALNRVLWPLPRDGAQPGGGFDGEGWPLGRELSNRELAVEVARVPGVSEVAGLNLFRFDAAAGWQALGDARTGAEQNLKLEKWQLPELRSVSVVVADAAPRSLTEGTANPFADDQAVAVPVVPKIC